MPILRRIYCVLGPFGLDPVDLQAFELLTDLIRVVGAASWGWLQITRAFDFSMMLPLETLRPSEADLESRLSLKGLL